MRQLDRYILREILYPTLIGLVALTFVFISRELSTLLEIIVRQSATPSQVWAVASAILPTVLTFTLPMGVLIGLLTGFGRLSSDSETVALRASGVPMRRILVPVLVLGLTAWIVNMTLTAWVAPQKAAELTQLKREIGLKQVDLQLQPGVFYEDIPGYTLYVKSLSPDRSVWNEVMVDDMKDPSKEKIIVAESSSHKLNETNHTFEITLKNGSFRGIDHLKPQQLDSETFIEQTISIPLPAGDTGPQTPPITEASTRNLWQHMQAGKATYEERVEFHRRFALPFACIAFALVGLPLGVSTTRGSKSMGLVMSLVLMFLYYLAFVGGTRLASDANFSPFLGAWIPNVIFLIVGLVLMSRADREHENHVLLWIRNINAWLGEKISALKQGQQQVTRWAYSLTHRSKMFRVLDRYVLRGFCFFFMLVLVVFIALFIVVTLFELLPDIVKNHVHTQTVLYYFLYLMPQILYWVVPLTVLLAILINLGTLTKGNEVLAVKAAGISLYRLSAPLLLMGMLVSCAIYLMQDFVLPNANKRQDQYRDVIKGRATQTYRNPNRKWMAGTNNRIYHYNYFDPAADIFENLSILTFDKNGFSLDDWTFATNAIWVDNTWILGGATVHRLESQDSNQPPQRIVLTDMDRPEYFKDDVRTASQMTYGELKRHIEELRKKQFDVTSLTLDLYRKLSFPMASFIMAIIGIPFSFKTGRKGAFYGIGICIGMGILYWSMFEVFDKMGEINRLSPIVAAWFPNLIFGLGGTWMFLRVKT